MEFIEFDKSYVKIFQKYCYLSLLPNSLIYKETWVFLALTQPITRLICSNCLTVLKEKRNLEKAPGGAHRVHFEHSLLYDSVTTISVAPGKNQAKKRKKIILEFAFVISLTVAEGLEKRQLILIEYSCQVSSSAKL